MKIKLEVDVQEIVQGLFDDANDNFDPEYGIETDVDLKEEVKKNIVNQAKTEVLKLITEPVRQQIQDQVKGLVSSEYGSVVSKKVAEFVKDGRVKKYSS